MTRMTTVQGWSWGDNCQRRTSLMKHRWRQLLLDQVASYQSNAPKKNERNFGGNNNKVELRTFTQQQYNFYNLLENTSQHNTRERHHVTYDINVGKVRKDPIEGATTCRGQAKPMPLPRGVGWPDHRSERIAAQSTHGHHSALYETWRCSEIIFHPPIEANPGAPVGKCFVCVEIFNLLHLTHTQIGLNVWDFERDLDVVLLIHYTTFH